MPNPVEGGIPAMVRPENVEEENEATALERRTVAWWTTKILAAKARWEPDFERMRMNMSFAASHQWNEQKKMDDKRYICNVVNREINRKVASLYARDPKAEFVRRPRMDFALWDEKNETMLQVGQRAMTNPMDMEAQAVISDYLQGMHQREKVDKLGRTLEILYQWMVEQQEPVFKKQFKKLVRRVATTGVGYVRRIFERASMSEAEEQDGLTVSTLDTSMPERAKRIKALLAQVQAEEIEPDSPRVQELMSLVASMGYSLTEGEPLDVTERLIYDFPRATSIIPDEDCLSLEDFEGCKWVAQEYRITLDDANAFFGTAIEKGGDLVVAGQDAEFLDAATLRAYQERPPLTLAPRVMLWQVWSVRDKSSFVICNGWHKWVTPPEPLTPCTRRFWPLFAITFNSIETEPDIEASVFPPSDVQLMLSAQKERNRSRERLRDHRTANQPRWAAAEGVLDGESKDRMESCVPHKVVEINLPPQGKLADVIYPMPTVPMQPELYDTEAVDNDILLATGAQQANLGPAQPDVTATVGSIAAQSAASESASNVDDLDELLTDMAKDGGEVLLKEMSFENVQRIVGPGAAWPSQPQERADYLNEIYLKVQAASTGRPNKALELSNWQVVAPILQANGANPQFIVRETLRRYDDRIDPADAFPLVQALQGAAAGPAPGQPAPAGGPPRGMPTPGPSDQGVGQPGAMKPPMPMMGNPS